MQVGNFLLNGLRHFMLSDVILFSIWLFIQVQCIRNGFGMHLLLRQPQCYRQLPLPIGSLMHARLLTSETDKCFAKLN